MPRYNFRMLRGARVVKKKEGNRIKRWESDYERFVKDGRNVLTLEEVMAEITQTFEDNAIEQEKVSLICPLTKVRIAVPVRCRNCRHLQCFDLKGILTMKTKINFLNCPICNTVVENELDGLYIDKYFQKIISEVSSAAEIVILGDGTFRVAPSHSAPIIPKVIDDEGPYVPENSTTRIFDVKSETFRNAVKPEIEIIEIDDDDEQAEVKQEQGQTPQDAALEVARSEIAQIHNAPAIDQTFPEAVPDPPHPLLPDTEPTLLPTFNQQSDLNQEPMEEPEIAPIIGFGDLTIINLYPDVISDANGSENNTTDHFHGTFEEVPDSDVARASMTAGQVSDNGSTHLPNLNEVSTVEEPNASNGITPTATSMPISTEIPSKSAEGPNKQLGSRKSKRRIAPQEPDRDENMALNLRLRDRKKVHYAEFEDHGLRVETKRYRLSRAKQNSEMLDGNSLASSIVDDPDQQQREFGERDESATDDDEESEYGLESETDGETLTSETRSEYDRFERETEETSTSKSRSRDSRKVNCHKRNENRHQGGSMQMQRDRRFKCKKCSYAATYRSHLIQHVRTHAGERPYKCRFCKFATAVRSSLIRHTRIHTGEKPYKCRLCKYATTQRCHLTRHIRVHTGEELYKCRYCQHASNQSSILKQHTRTQHKDALKLNSANSKKIPNASCSRNPKD